MNYNIQKIKDGILFYYNLERIKDNFPQFNISSYVDVVNLPFYKRVLLVSNFRFYHNNFIYTVIAGEMRFSRCVYYWKLEKEYRSKTKDIYNYNFKNKSWQIYFVGLDDLSYSPFECFDILHEEGVI